MPGTRPGMTSFVTGVAQKQNLLNHFNKSTRRANHLKLCQALSRKNILIFRIRKSVYIARIPSQQEGAFRERHGRRGGDAVDATARETGEADADGEIVWS